MKKLLLLLFPALAFAQDDWEYVGSSTDKSCYYIKDVEKKSYGDRVYFGAKLFHQTELLKLKKEMFKKRGGTIWLNMRLTVENETTEQVLNRQNKKFDSVKANSKTFITR